MATTICAGPTNSPLNGLRYRVVVSVPRVLDSAIVEQSLDDVSIATGGVPSASIPPYTLKSSVPSPRETRMENTVVTPITNCPNYARVTSNIIVPMTLEFTDNDGTTFLSNTVYNYPTDVVLYVPENATFSYEVSSEGSAIASGGTGNRDTTTITKLCTRIITRVTATTDLLIPAYGYAPIPQAVAYENPACKDFFAQPLFPSGRATKCC